MVQLLLNCVNFASVSFNENDLHKPLKKNWIFTVTVGSVSQQGTWYYKTVDL